jgi:hypothetical protein
MFVKGIGQGVSGETHDVGANVKKQVCARFNEAAILGCSITKGGSQACNTAGIGN